MTNKDHKVKEMQLMKLPTEQINFLKRNPILAEKLGQIMVALTELDLTKKELLSILDDTNLIKTHLQDGTEEELVKFIAEAKQAQKDAVKFEDLPDGAFEEIKKQMGERLFVTDVKLSKAENH